ncbi:MAG: hypothetical protein J7M34_05995 [Anaerolineae bacterium]|nr:hypothetical protein [Anaerolineae bacterium]
MEYLTISEVRDELGEDVSSLTDAAIVRRLDRLSAYMEQTLGHTFGRALVARSSDETHTVEVTDDLLIIGGDTYPLDDYANLGVLVDAVNGAGAVYSLELLPRVHPETPTSLLKPMAVTACGGSYDRRAILDVEGLYLRVSGDGSTHLFLPLPLRSVTAVTEDGVELVEGEYTTIPGECWIERHYTTWSTRNPGNIVVIYVPELWNRVPWPVKAALLDALAAASNLTPVVAESFGGAYSYRRAEARTASWSWQDILGGPTLRPYAVRFHP